MLLLLLLLLLLLPLLLLLLPLLLLLIARPMHCAYVCMYECINVAYEPLCDTQHVLGRRCAQRW
eukprot:COSAG01_NODE_949_length_12505_cov_3.853539_8_plen_64_part_00